MKPNKPFETYQNRVAQFEQSEKAIRTSATKTKTSAVVPEPNNQNPYLKARMKILSNYSREHRAEILAYERDNNLDNRFYAEFCHDVALLGDQFMPI